MTRGSEPEFEFSRPIEMARIPKLGSHEKLSANAKECSAMAKRLGVPMLYSLSAELKVKPWRGGGLKVAGQLKADLDQQSVVSLETFRSSVNYDIERYFLNAPRGEELESDEDIDPIENGVIDLGEVVAETLALELDPYPRKSGEEFETVGIEENVVEPEKPNPFNVLRMEPRKK
jgi:Large ribosomal RNA subunit accumulation protein YceD